MSNVIHGMATYSVSHRNLATHVLLTRAINRIKVKVKTSAMGTSAACHSSDREINRLSLNNCAIDDHGD